MHNNNNRNNSNRRNNCSCRITTNNNTNNNNSSCVVQMSTTSSSSTLLLPLNKIQLTNEQTDKLKTLVDRPISIYPTQSSQTHYPQLSIIPKDFIRLIKTKFLLNNIEIDSIRLNGGAASYVITTNNEFVYRDLDILFFVRSPLNSEQKTNLFSKSESHISDVWTIIKFIVCECLLSYFPNNYSDNYSHHYISSLLDTYSNKNVKITHDNDSWALLSLQNLSGQNLELKFVEKLKRQWQFSVDSFQIALDPLLSMSSTPIKQEFIFPSAKSILTKCPSISSITKTITTKNLTVQAINGLNIIKKEQVDHNEYDVDDATVQELTFGFFTPPSRSPILSALYDNNDKDEEEADKYQTYSTTLATITTISNILVNCVESTKDDEESVQNDNVKECNGDNNNLLQFHISVNENDSSDDGIVMEEEDEEDDDSIKNVLKPSSPSTICVPTMKTIIPTSNDLIIDVYSVYNDIGTAINHLNNKLISTYEPEQMRGGGLLKYCNLLARDFVPADRATLSKMEKYMCSRFFIDYKSLDEQMYILRSYIESHFDLTNYLNYHMCYLFLEYLARTITTSTVCLVKDDKSAILDHIHQSKRAYLDQYKHLSSLINNRTAIKFQQQQHHTHSSSSSASSTSSGSRSSSPQRNRSHNNNYYYHHRNQYYYTGYNNNNNNNIFYKRNQISNMNMRQQYNRFEQQDFERKCQS
ncbi:unnamed protein product [Didymodactylos carnosus]|uniref:polynucleotide adenylyltransferase n=1 Tax=Didymodactylos carnosus TaxID=1234261 RepID=A0A815GJJ7_9BILA|nr:unnamed protein product [Didymodactylos carnosus]CAF1339105.1 unnamed protein product [Didymodactylos carnosus]CAF4059246.1 unnamed protein product [Didymodactylos carnosus]CAF4198484.1 unnamed protein product [Didymodactylos carnosus]